MATTTTTQTAYRRRTEILREIGAGADHHRLPGVWDSFVDEADLLRAAQQFWQRHLTAAVDCALETGDGSLVDDVSEAYAAAAARFPGVRRLLDQHRGDPAIAYGLHREMALIEQASGESDARRIIERASGLRVSDEHEPGVLARAWGVVRWLFGPSVGPRSVWASS